MRYLSLLIAIIFTSIASAQLTTQTTAQINAGSLEIPTGQYRIVINSDTGEQYLATGTGTGSTYEMLGDHQPVMKMATVESEYFTKSGVLPKLAYYDQDIDTYKSLYGKLFHPIRTNDNEFVPNVIVSNIVDNGATDVVDYYEISAAVRFQVVGHGLALNATLYVGNDGELTTEHPNAYRTIRVGQVLDVNTLLITPAEVSIRPIAQTYQFHNVTVWERIPPTSVSSIAIGAGSADIRTSDVTSNGTPSSADLIAALFDPQDTDEVIFSNDNGGLTITLARQCWVSDIQMQLGRGRRWWEDGQATQRDTFDVEIYTQAADGIPAETIKVWDRADGVVSRGQGINHTVKVDQIVEKIVLVWDTSTGVIGAQGTLQTIHLWGKERTETLDIKPGCERWKFERWSIPKHQKPVFASARVDVDTSDRTGITLNAQELGQQQIHGLYSDWTPTPGTVVDASIMDVRAYRDFVHDSINSLTWDRVNQPALSIDLETADWIYEAADDQATVDSRDARWMDVIANIRSITPLQLTAPYTHPFRNSSMALAYFYFGQSNGQQQYEGAIQREEKAAKLYEWSDLMAPTMYANDTVTYDFDTWKYMVSHAVEECHKRGRFCVPHFSGWDYTRDEPIPNIENYIDYILEVADGIWFWDGAFSWTETQKQTYAAAIRNSISKSQSGYTHTVTPSGDLVPDVSGQTVVQTSGNGDAITGFKGGKPNQLLFVELADGDSLVAGTGPNTLDFGPNGPGSPWAPVGGGTMLLRHDGTNWIRLIHQ